MREKQGVFSQNQGGNVQIRELFFKTIFKPFKPFNLRKNVFLRLKTFFSRAVRKVHLMRQNLYRLMSLRPHLKRINMVFFTKVSWWKLRKNQGKVMEFDRIKKWEPWSIVIVTRTSSCLYLLFKSSQWNVLYPMGFIGLQCLCITSLGLFRDVKGKFC